MGLVGAVALVGASAVSAGGEPPQPVRPGSGGSSSGGFITGASMSISGKAFGTTTSLAQLTTVAAHEWGHVLGLNHANGTGELMSPVLDPAVTTIQSCDLAAAQTALGWFVPINTDVPVPPPSSQSCV